MGDRPELWEIDWDDLYPRLLLVALGMTKGRANQRTLAEDLVQDAVLKTKTGVRNWDPRMSLFLHLAGVIKSDLYHFTHSAEQTKCTNADDVVIQLADHRPNQEEDEIYRSQERELIRFISKRNSQASRMALIILRHDLQTSSELSKAMDTEITKIDHLKKKLRTIVVDYLRSPLVFKTGGLAASLLAKIPGGADDDK